MSDTMHYFKAVEGHACRRFGSQTFIGCTRGPDGYKWNLDVVVAIPEVEMLPYRKDYNQYVKHGDLLRATKADYDEYVASRTAASEAIAAKRKSDRAAAAKVAANGETESAPAASADDTNQDDTDVDAAPDVTGGDAAQPE